MDETMPLEPAEPLFLLGGQVLQVPKNSQDLLISDKHNALFEKQGLWRHQT